jgi:hypothetical protein
MQQQNSGIQKLQRIKPFYTQKVPIPSNLTSLLWDEQDTAPLEKLILRVLQYGNYEEIHTIYSLYSTETTDIVSRYPDIKRGVKFWVRYWNEHN